MAGRILRVGGATAGGIIGLAKQTLAHRGAIEHDLLTQTGYEVKDIGGALSWSAFDSFVRHLGPGSALARDIDPESAAWSETLKTNGILADIWDALMLINANLIAMGSGKRAKEPRTYPRPWMEDQKSDGQHFGSGAVPVDELQAFFEEKRRQHARSSTGDNISHASHEGRTADHHE